MLLSSPSYKNDPESAMAFFSRPVRGQMADKLQSNIQQKYGGNAPKELQGLLSNLLQSAGSAAGLKDRLAILDQAKQSQDAYAESDNDSRGYDPNSHEIDYDARTKDEMNYLTNSVDGFAKKTSHMSPKQLRSSFSRSRLEGMYDEVGHISQLNGDVEGTPRGELRDKIVDALAAEWQKDDEDQYLYNIMNGHNPEGRE